MTNKRKNQGGKKKKLRPKQPKPVKRKRKPTGKSAVLVDFREFKQRFHIWADKITIDWTKGKPFEPGSDYRFILPQPMVDFIVSLVQKSHTKHDPAELKDIEAKAERQRLEQIKQLREALANGVGEKLEASDQPAADEDTEDDDGPVKDRRTFRGSLNEGQENQSQEGEETESQEGEETESL